MFHRLYRAAPIACVLALASTTTWMARADAPAATVTMTDQNRFDPSSVTIKVGQTVLWNNTSALTHTVTADPARAADPADVKLPPGAQPFDSGRLRPGTQFSHTFTTPGVYKYFCIPHERKGMVAFVTVQP